MTAGQHVRLPNGVVGVYNGDAADGRAIVKIPGVRGTFFYSPRSIRLVGRKREPELTLEQDRQRINLGLTTQQYLNGLNER